MRFLRAVSVVLLAACGLVLGNLPAHAAQSYWEGYGWYNPARVSVDFTIPNIRGASGNSVAFWAGFGHADPHIQQAGVTGTVGKGWSAWWEDWPAGGHSFHPPVPPHSGDVMQFIVTYKATVYTMTVNDVTRHWSQSTRQLDTATEAGGEAVTENYGGINLPDYGPARFTYANGPVGGAGAWHFPFGGSTLRKTGTYNFQDSRP